MLFAKKRFRSKCINNKYMDFGSHTGFTERESIYGHLVVGDWYDFEVDDNGRACIVSNDLKYYNGYFFYSREDINSRYHSGIASHIDFYLFFESIDGIRNSKLESIGI